MSEKVWQSTYVGEFGRRETGFRARMAPPPGFNTALNQARDEAYARAARGTDGSFGVA